MIQKQACDSFILDIPNYLNELTIIWFIWTILLKAGCAILCFVFEIPLFSFSDLLFFPAWKKQNKLAYLILYYFSKFPNRFNIAITTETKIKLNKFKNHIKIFWYLYLERFKYTYFQERDESTVYLKYISSDNIDGNRKCKLFLNPKLKTPHMSHGKME